MDCGNFHFQRDGGRPCIERTAKNVRETQHIVDLIGVISAASRNDGVTSHRLDFFRQDLRRRIGQGKNQRIRRHPGHHVAFEHTTGGEPKKHVGTLNGLAQCACRCLLREKSLVLVHQLGATLVNHTGQVSDKNVVSGNAQLDQQAKAGQRCSASTRGHQLDLRRIFADHFEPIQNGSANHNRRAMLVVVKHRDLHTFAQLALDIKTVRCFDVFEIDATKGRLQRGDDLNKFVKIVFFVDLNIKNVNAGKLFEQYPLAFHHRLGRQRADIAQAQHRGAVGDDRHQVASAGVFECRVGVPDNLLARGGHTRRIRQRQVMLVG